MANTKNNTQVVINNNLVVQYFTLVSDGTNESATVIYDSSVVATTLNQTDPLNCSLYDIRYSVSTAATARVQLLFDATTDVLALDLVPIKPMHFDFKCFGGLPNYAGTGKTGDILLTTSGLASGDLITIVFTVRPN